MKNNTSEIMDELKKLRETNQLLTHLIEHSSDMLYRMSLPDGRYEYVSSASLRIFGYPPADFYNAPLLIRKVIHPDWMNYLEEQWHLLIAGKMPPSYEYQIIDKQGHTRWIHQKNVLVCDQNGTPTAIEGLVTDITEQKNAETARKIDEARLREAQQMAHIGYWYWDIKTGDVEWSDEVFEIFRLDPTEFKPQIDSIMSLSPWPEENKRNQELVQKAIESREKGSFEQRFLFPDGSTGYYFSTYEGIFNDDGDIIAMRGTVQDITERKQMEIEKKHLEEQYRQAQKIESIGRLAGGVAHDLNNLLTPILGFSEMLMDDFPLDDHRRESVDEIMRAGLRAKCLVTQLLAFSRKQLLEYRVLDINQIIIGIEKLLQHTIREDIAIDIIPSAMPLPIKADSGQIEQVLLNLAVNAQDAMPDGGMLTIETQFIPEEIVSTGNSLGHENGALVMLMIHDTGCGMDEETREHIFEPFFSTKGELGTGLGLATVYGIIKQHGGNIVVQSELDVGTTFTIYLPFHPDTVIEKSARGGKIVADKGHETVLLAEDNEHVRRLTKEILRRCGYQVIEADTGSSALSALDSHGGDIHLLLTDVVMPEMNGRELFARAVKKRPGLKVLYMSGYTDNVIARHGMLEDGTQFIEKPFSIQSLAAKIREVLES